MVATYQYPQYIYALNSGGDSVQLPNGSWVTPEAAWELKGSCREETNGKGSSINTADGKALVFSSLVQIPKGTARIPEGTNVLIAREKIEDTAQLQDKDFINESLISGLIVLQGECKKYDLGRLHCRMWI